MHTNSVKSAIRRATMVLLALAACLVAGQVFAQQSDDPEHCGTITHYPGAVTVVGKAWGNATQGDFRICSTTYQCSANAKSAEVFGVGYSSHAEGVIATENYAAASDGTEAILASCEAISKDPGKVRSCMAQKQSFQLPTSVAEQASCTVAVGAPAKGWTAASATCFCEG
jgi:hypothetical protein